jgi:hypothetical protein
VRVVHGHVNGNAGEVFGHVRSVSVHVRLTPSRSASGGDLATPMIAYQSDHVESSHATQERFACVLNLQWRRTKQRQNLI